MNHTNTNYFSQLASINISEHIEKKGQFNYLSWPYAVAQLRLFDETATWEVKRFDGLPFLSTEHGTFVEVAVTVRGVTLSQIHPVLDGKNRPLLAPDAFDINTSIQRCLVKGIALHGLGLNVYAGEDLPQGESGGITPSQSSLPTRASMKSVSPYTKRDKGITAPELLTVKQLAYIKKLLKETGTDIEQLLAFFDFDALEQIPKSEVNRVIRVLETHRHQAAA